MNAGYPIGRWNEEGTVLKGKYISVYFLCYVLYVNVYEGILKIHRTKREV